MRGEELTARLLRLMTGMMVVGFGYKRSVTIMIGIMDAVERS